jgi:hypothetical protein
LQFTYLQAIELDKIRTQDILCVLGTWIHALRSADLHEAAAFMDMSMHPKQRLVLFYYGSNGF